MWILNCWSLVAVPDPLAEPRVRPAVLCIRDCTKSKVMLLQAQR